MWQITLCVSRNCRLVLLTFGWIFWILFFCGVSYYNVQKNKLSDVQRKKNLQTKMKYIQLRRISASSVSLLSSFKLTSISATKSESDFMLCEVTVFDCRNSKKEKEIPLYWTKFDKASRHSNKRSAIVLNTLIDVRTPFSKCSIILCWCWTFFNLNTQPTEQTNTKWMNHSNKW